jgi:copper chaperone CopZ
MKNILIACLILVSTSVVAKTITKQIVVEGNCEMCKDRIEKALDIPGISFAEWNQETKMLTVRFNNKKISENEIHTLISNTGYATNKVAANTVAQSKLDSCCKPKKGKKKCCAGSSGCSK